MLETIAQVMIVICSGASTYLLSRGKVKEGCITGLSSEVFWGYTSITHAQWGVFLMVLWFSWCFASGLYKQCDNCKVRLKRRK